MRTRYGFRIDGVDLSQVDPAVYVTDISYIAPVREMSTKPLAGRDGQIVSSLSTRSASVTVSFEIHEPRPARRMQILEEIQRMMLGNHEISTSDRPERRLLAVCESPPALGSVLRYTSNLTATFTAFPVPFWEDAYTQSVKISGSGTKTAPVPGYAAAAGISCTVKNEGETKIERVELTAGKSKICFEGLALLSGKTLSIGHDENGIFFAKIGETSVLSLRTPESSDDLLAPPGPQCAFGVQAGNGAKTEFVIRGRYL